MTGRNGYRVVVGLTAGWLLTAALGCSSRMERFQERLAAIDRPATQARVSQAIGAAGGVDPWGRVQSIRGESLTVASSRGARQMLLEQVHEISWEDEAAILVRTQRADGIQIEQLTAGGALSGWLKQQVVVEPLVLDQSEAAVRLRLLYHALTGVPGLLEDETVQLAYRGRERQGGVMTDKLEVAGGLFGQTEALGRAGSEQLVLWLDAETHLPVRIWLRYEVADVPEGVAYIAAMLSDYRTTNGGLQVPGRIEILASDVYQQLFAEQTQLIVQYKEVEATFEAPQKGLGF